MRGTRLILPRVRAVGRQPFRPPAPPPPGGGTHDLTFTVDTSTSILNPERGFHADYGAGSGSQLANVRGQGYTLNRTYFRLDDYRTANIPTSLLNSYTTFFGLARSAGIKCIIRWSYNSGYQDDAPLNWVLTHIQQLGPIWRDNADVIAVLQGGFIGAWGEWHSSTNGLTSASNMRTILEAILAELPDSRMAQVRTPGYMRNMYGNTPLAFDDRFLGGVLARMGFKNDCFQTNSSDAGTYNNQADRDYANAMAVLTCTGGETCEVGGLNSWNDCAPSMATLALQGWDYLNDSFYAPVLSKWETAGCKATIARLLGHRLALTHAILPTTIAAGAPMTVRLTMQNTGYGKVYNPRPIDLVLVGPGGPFTTRLTADARRSLPLGGQTASMQFTANAPAGLQANQAYAAHLRLPDASASIAADNRYAIQLANTGGLYDANTGRHNLGATLMAA